MLKKLLLFVTAFLFISSTLLIAQEADARMGTSEQDIMHSDEQANPFPPKPKNMWEIGLQGGTSMLTGDVSPKYPVPFSGFAVGLHLRKAINYTFSIRLEGNYGQTVGINKMLSSYSVTNKDIDIASLGYKEGDAFLRNYKMEYWEGSIQGIMNMGNILFHQRDNKWNLYVMVGAGLINYNTHIDALNEDGNPYQFTGFTKGETIEGRKANQDRFLDLSDGDFETAVKDVFQGSTASQGLVFYENRKDAIRPFLEGGLGITRKISERFNIGLEHKIIYTGDDQMDGFTYRSTGDKSNSPDVLHHSTIQLNFNLGSKEKRVEPLYWVNPLVSPLEDIAEVKARPVFDLTDSDGDGVPDMWDEDPNTPPGVAVDVKGRPIDSDGDGIPDYLDKEPFSPKGYDVDEDGVAIIDDPYLTESQVKTLIANQAKEDKVNWFLPMIHFDLDKYYIKPEFVPQLKHVAQVIKNNPNIKIAINGYADNRATEKYNEMLSYNRAEATANYLVEKFDVPRDRLILQYRGESSPLISGLSDSHNLSQREEYMQYMNRRVEFHVATPNDKEMSKPDGPKAGSGTPGSSRSGSKYSGNRDSGY